MVALLAGKLTVAGPSPGKSRPCPLHGLFLAGAGGSLKGALSMIIRRSLEPRGRKLQVGDKVRLRHGTAGWAQHSHLRDQIGEVVALVDDGTQLYRITVAFADRRLPPGMYEEHFEKGSE